MWPFKPLFVWELYKEELKKQVYVSAYVWKTVTYDLYRRKDRNGIWRYKTVKRKDTL